jgi:hypothetical protein
MYLRPQSLLLLLAALPAVAAKIPTSLNDNVVTCTAASGCTNQTLYGRTYKVIHTPNFDVMVSISSEGAYTRADVSLSNHLSYPQNVSPDDFRVEVVDPKPHVLLYIPPSQLQNLPASATTAQTPAPPTPPPPTAQKAIPTTNLDIDELYRQAKLQAALKDAADRKAAQQPLPATPIAPNDTVRGRVYFESDNKARLVNVVLPIAGVVYEFPFVLRK